MDRERGEGMVELSILANNIVKTIEREDAFEDSKNKGGFIEIVKAKNIKEIFL